MIAIVIPAYQPEGTLVTLLEQLRALTDMPVVVVNDGSRPDCAPVFDKAQSIDGITVIRHAVNLGKGAALKTAFNYALCAWPDLTGVVTADADGQHLPVDIVRVAERLNRESTALILGARQFDGEVPLRSRLGNRITVGVMRLVAGHHLTDTQTGLRGVPRTLLPYVLRIQFELVTG